MKYVKMQVLFNFYELKLVMPRLIYGIKLLVGGVVAWELDAWDKSDGYGMRNMNLVWDRCNSMSLVGRSHGGV